MVHESSSEDGGENHKLTTWTGSRGSQATSGVRKFYFCPVRRAAPTDLNKTRIESMTCQKQMCNLKIAAFINCFLLPRRRSLTFLLRVQPAADARNSY